MGRGELLQRHPSGQAREVDEAEVARGDGDQVDTLGGSPRFGTRLARRGLVAAGSELDDAVLGLRSEGRSSEATGDALDLGHLREHGVGLAPLLDASRGLPDLRLATHQLVDHVGEGLAVALEEGGAQALAVVGDDDELVRTRRRGGGLLQGGDRLVDPVERVERLAPLGSAVVGDLVVVGVVDEDDGGAAVHLLDDERGRQVAQGDVRRGARDRVGHPAVHQGHDPRPLLPPRLEVLLEDLGDRADDRVKVVVRAGEEREEGLALAEPLALVLDRGHRDVRADGVAGEEVADARPVVRQQALAVRDPGRDLGGIRRVVGDQDPVGFLLVPPEGRDAVVVAVQDPGLARRRGRRQECLPAREPVAAGAHPGRQVGDPAGPNLAGEDRVGQPVDLHDDEAGLVRAHDVLAPGRELLDQHPEVRVVVADREDRGRGSCSRTRT